MPRRNAVENVCTMHFIESVRPAIAIACAWGGESAQFA
ncbi:hypothetical protein BBB_0887 [Bifidobacterium bifidum BGN4]|uniref:Uncharacterized protein n=1 Tax=Bifidobacterium bifidum BGN4 TaxID=484020 RepID=I3WHW6_BIFBI|nr:hypothetical protein BBB_0887 [Bifidobacterium bifidum BGN4]ALE11365.1 Hypothetical protein RY70_1006 [Bifidobacterium bifidum]